LFLVDLGHVSPRTAGQSFYRALNQLEITRML